MDDPAQISLGGADSLGSGLVVTTSVSWLQRFLVVQCTPLLLSAGS